MVCGSAQPEAHERRFYCTLTCSKIAPRFLPVFLRMTSMIDESRTRRECIRYCLTLILRDRLREVDLSFYNLYR